MSGARISTLATLRGSIERIETHGAASRSTASRSAMREADAALQGGLARGARA